jgi:hypothetical protein
VSESWKARRASSTCIATAPGRIVKLVRRDSMQTMRITVVDVRERSAPVRSAAEVAARPGA